MGRESVRLGRQFSDGAMTFTPRELRLLHLSDQVEDTETDAEKQVRWSAESKARRRARLGEAAFREAIRRNTARWRAKQKKSQP